MEGQEHKTTGVLRVGSQLSKNENKGAVFLENRTLNFLSPLQSVAMTCSGTQPNRFGRFLKH